MEQVQTDAQLLFARAEAAKAAHPQLLRLGLKRQVMKSSKDGQELCL
jgi:hypothetical protein